MRIRDLYYRHRGQTIYILGTGPSLRVTPLEILQGAVTIGLNQAWRHHPCTYNLTVHPELLQDYEREAAGAKRQRGAGPAVWLVKQKPPMASLTLDDPNYYVFRTAPDLQTVTLQPDDTLYIGEGVQCTAMDLACRMGARAVVLVGCDACSLGGDFHGHDQHVRWLGQTPEAQYALYRKQTALVRKVLRGRGLPVYTLSPFVGVGHADEDYRRLCKEHKLPPLPRPRDVSPYVRKKS
jgi:hypothetical protein